MTYLLLGAFLVLVGVLSWISYRRRTRVSSCCAPADPRDDLRMRSAFVDDPDRMLEP